MKKIILISVLSILPLLIGCNDYVTGIDKYIDRIQDEQLADRAQLTFLQNGLFNSFANAYDHTTVLADALSDAFVFDDKKNKNEATFDTYKEIDIARLISRQNQSITPLTSNLGEFRYVADQFLVKVAKMKFKPNDPAEKTAKFYGNFFGGVARYFYASYIGLDKTVGGAPEKNNGVFLPSKKLYEQAVVLIKEALTFGNPTEKKIANTMLAKIYISQNNYTEANKYIAAGLQKGDNPFKALFSTAVANDWATEAGATRAQFTVAPRFVTYFQAEPKRVPIKPQSQTYRQDKQGTKASPITFLSWQENALMKAEIALSKNNSATALTEINSVRSSYGLSALTTVNMDVLLVERDKELFCQGARLIDQRRHNKFHVDGGFQYLPIQQREADANPNIKLP